MATYLTPQEVDELLKLPNGRARRMAKRGQLPAVLLPDGTVRFELEGLESFLRGQAPASRNEERARACAKGTKRNFPL